MSVKEQIVTKLRDAGYDMLTACEEADRVIAEFLTGTETERVFGVMVGGKAVDAFKLQRNAH